MLLMTLPNEHLLTSSHYKDAKTLFEAIKARFGGNEATKKTQKMYENFSASSGESLDSIFNKLQKIINLDQMTFDDLYNNFKIVEQEVTKRNAASRSDLSSQNVAFVSTPTSTKDINTDSIQVNTGSISIGNSSLIAANKGDATVYAYLSSQPNGFSITYEDLDQIHDDDLEEMELKWNMALISMRARKFYKRTRRKISFEEGDTARYDKSKVECYNCHKMGHFARECRSARNKDNMSQEGSKKTVIVEDTSTAMVAFDGTGFDWSFMADKEAPTNMALMAFSDSEVLNDKTCSNSCLKNYETLKNQHDNLRVELNKSNYDLANYKRGLAYVEEQLVFYKKNEVALCDQIVVLKRDASFKDSEINALKIQVENLKKKRRVISLKLTHMKMPLRALMKCIEEFQQPEFPEYGAKNVSEKSPNETKKTLNAPIIEDWVSDCDEDDSEVREINVQTKPKQANKPRKTNEVPRNNSSSWNKPMPKKSGVEFQFKPKACFVCGSFSYLIKECDFHDKRMAQKPVVNNLNKGTGQREVRPVWNQAIRTNHQNFSNLRRNFVPKAVLNKSGVILIGTGRTWVPFSTARPISTGPLKTSMNVAKPKTNVFQRPHSHSIRPICQQTTLKNRISNNKVNSTRVNSVNTSKEKEMASAVGKVGNNAGEPHVALKDTRIFDSGCSRHMTGNKSYLTEYEDHDGGFVAFAGSTKGGKITGKGKIKTEHLDFEDVYFVKELKFNLFSVSQMCDKKHNVLFTETECLILSPEFKLPDENQVMLKIPRKDNMYSFDLKNIVPSKGLTCLIAKATNDESKMWHRRLGHINFKTINKLVKGNLVRGLPSKLFENDHTCVACQKGKQHKASCKTKLVNSISKPLQILHMDLFGPTFVKSIMGKMYCLVITDDYSRCDNGTKFKNYEIKEFHRIKGIKREFSNAKTPQQNGVAERKNRTLIEAARTMLADSLLPIPFWAEAINTACYVQNRVLVTKPHNKTPYELLIGRTPTVSFMRPFGCPITILNTLDHLGKFDGKADEGFLVGYSINSKAFRVFNSRTRKVEENLHVNFLENKPNVTGSGPKWLFDIDILTNTMNYHPVSAGNRTNGNAGIETNSDAGQAEKEKNPDQEYILLPLMDTSSYIHSSSKKDESSLKDDVDKKKEVLDLAKEDDMNKSGKDTNADRTNKVNTSSSPVNSASSSFSYEDQEKSREQRNEFENVFGQDENAYKEFTPVDVVIPSDDPIDPLMPDLEDIPNTGIFGNAYDDEDVGAEADMNNLETTINVSPIPTTRIDKDHPKAQVIGEMSSAVQTRRMHKQNETGLVSFINKQRRTNHKDYENCLLACFLSQIEPKKVTEALEKESWVEAMQEELLQFKLLNVWTLVELPYGKKAIGTKWVFRNKKDQRGTVVRNKDRLVAQGFRQEEGIDYDEVFTPVARIEAIRLFLAYASYMDFTVYQMDVKSAFLYGTIEEEMSSMGELTFFLGLQVEQRADGIFLSQDKYVYEILKKFGYSNMKTASTPMETQKPLTKDENGADVDVHLYRSMIGSLMYLTSSRLDIMFVVCACSRFQVQPKASHLHAIKRIFRYLKGQSTLGLLYAKDSPLELVAYSDSDYAGVSIDRKSTIGGCQFLGYRLVSWQCKKQIIIAKSTTEAEYIAASNCCAQHNMVAFLKKPTESEGFTQAVDFLKGNALNYALTYNPTVYDSLVKQFWQTATVRTFANGTQQIEASIDNKPYNITKASVRSKLNWQMQQNFVPQWKFIIHHLVHCISPKSGGWDQFGSSLATALICLSGKYLPKMLTKKIFTNMRRGYEGDFVPLLPVMLAGAAQVQGHHSDREPEIHQSLVSFTPTFVADKATSTRSQSGKLEKELRTQKKTFGKVFLHCKTRVEELVEVALKRKSKKALSPSKNSVIDQGEDIIPLLLWKQTKKTLSKVASQQPKSVDKGKRYKEERVMVSEFNTGIVEVNTGSLPVSTGSGVQLVLIVQESYFLLKIKAKEKGKGLCYEMVHDGLPKESKGHWKLTQTKTLSFEEIKYRIRTTKRLNTDDLGVQLTKERMDEAKEEESVKKMGKRKKQIARKGLHTEKTKEDEAEKDIDISEKDDPSSGTDVLVNHVPILRENGTDKVYVSFRAMLKDISRDDLTELYRIVMQRYGMIGPEDDYENVLWEYLKNMFDAPLSTDSVWSLPGQQRIISWRYYSTCRVHCLSMELADIYMLTERSYPLSAEYCTKALATPEQTATGKEISNPLTADSLLKTIRIARIFEASRARGFFPSFTRASNPQLHLGIQYPNLID
ncbi:putative ribonuclease H-like domain-containing protein [Tanacetum coccineum]|uniref:Ribonuclease H-like domain-containing protein n=1 Tax=Tanacetum coccineum TaxID=301880 RepID=A0ABQ5DA22_9ASTR